MSSTSCSSRSPRSGSRPGSRGSARCRSRDRRRSTRGRSRGEPSRELDRTDRKERKGSAKSAKKISFFFASFAILGALCGPSERIPNTVRNLDRRLLSPVVLYKRPGWRVVLQPGGSMALDLTRERGMPLEKQLAFSWPDLCQLPTSKLNDDAFTRVRIVYANGIEAEANGFQHAYARFAGALRNELAMVRRIEHFQQTLVNW